MKSLLFVIVWLWSSACAAQDCAGSAPGLRPEVAGLGAIVARWRSAVGVRAETRWTQTIPSVVLRRRHRSGGTGAAGARPAETEASATAVFAASGRKYRLAQEYSTDAMRNMSFEAAYDGARFEMLFKTLSQLRYSKAADRKALCLFLPIVQIAPLEFLSSGRLGKFTGHVAWPDLFDEKAVSARLRSGVVGTIGSGGRKRPVVTFGGGLYNGQPVSYRLVVDRPDGQPSEVDLVDAGGKTRFQMAFTYAPAKGAPGWQVPVRMDSKAFDAAGNVAASSVGESRSVDVAARFAEDEFTIDLLSANTVYDVDARKTVAGARVLTPDAAQTRAPHANGGDAPPRPQNGG